MIPRFINPSENDLSLLSAAVDVPEEAADSPGGAEAPLEDFGADGPADVVEPKTAKYAANATRRMKLPNVAERAYLQGKLHVLFDHKRELLLKNTKTHLLVDAFDRALPMRAPATPPNGPIDVAKWLASYRRFCAMTCAISVPDQYLGSGFLVGRNLVLTSRHVLRRLFSRGVQPEDVSCTFDQQLDEYGVVSNPTDRVTLKRLPPVKTDVDLDFVIMETNGDPGHTVVSSGVRGWVVVHEDPMLITPWLFVGALHRPQPNHLLFSPGVVVGIEEPFIEYTLSMGPGSSGSPIFSLNWKLVAVHNRRADAKDLELKNNGERVDEGIEPAVTAGVLASAIYEAIERMTGRPPERPPFTIEIE